MPPGRSVTRPLRPAYRFARWPDDGRLRRLVREAHGLAIDELIAGPLVEPEFIRNAGRHLMPIGEFFGSGGMPFRAKAAAARAPLQLASPAPARAVSGVWVLAEPVVDDSGSLRRKVGSPLDVSRALFLGERKGVVRLTRGVEVAVDFVADGGFEAYPAQKRALFADRAIPGTSAGGDAEELRRRLRGEELPAAQKEALEMRVLDVRYDEHGVRYRPWKEAASAMVEDSFEDWPIEGPRTTKWLARTFSRSGLSPTAWVERFLHTARWSDTDRSIHELRAIAKYLEAAGSYDQLNLPSLASMEHVARRWLVIMEAHSANPTQPDYDASGYIMGDNLETMGVDPRLKTYVAKQMRDDPEVRGLKTAGGAKGPPGARERSEGLRPVGLADRQDDVRECLDALLWCGGAHFRPHPLLREGVVGDLVRRRVEERGRPSSIETEEEAARALLRGRSGYAEGGSTVIPFRAELVALPEDTSGAPFVCDVLPAEAAKFVADGYRPMLKDQHELLQAVDHWPEIRPYMDVVLQRERKK